MATTVPPRFASDPIGNALFVVHRHSPVDVPGSHGTAPHPGEYRSARPEPAWKPSEPGGTDCFCRDHNLQPRPSASPCGGKRPCTDLPRYSSSSSSTTVRSTAPTSSSGDGPIRGFRGSDASTLVCLVLATVRSTSRQANGSRSSTMTTSGSPSTSSGNSPSRQAHPMPLSSTASATLSMPTAVFSASTPRTFPTDVFAPVMDGWFLWVSGTIVRRALLERVGGYTTSLECHEDIDLWLRVCCSRASRAVPNGC